MRRAKDFFLSVRDAEHKLKSLMRRRQHYEEMASNITGMSQGNIRSRENRSRTESAALRLIETAEALDDESEQYAELIRQAEALIKRIEKPRYRDVLELRYLCGLSWRTICDEMGYRDQKSAYRVHGWALAEAQKLLDEV